MGVSASVCCPAIDTVNVDVKEETLEPSAASDAAIPPQDDQDDAPFSARAKWSRLQSAVNQGQVDGGEGRRRPSQDGGLGQLRAFIYGLSWILQASNREEDIPDGWRLARPSGNRNVPQDYAWLLKTLEQLARHEASTLDCVDAATGKGFTPLFFVIGACPNALCGMQAVMYAASQEDGRIDFWWVKPQKGKPGELERETLKRQGAGPHKNDPGRSKPFYQPLADLFLGGGEVRGWRFGIETFCTKTGSEAPRAFIQCTDPKKRPSVELVMSNDAADPPHLEVVAGQIAGEPPQVRSQHRKLLVHLLWQEDWTSNPFASSKYVKGKIVYQKMAGALQYFSRQYEIHDGAVSISEHEEKAFSSTLPGEEIKNIWECP